MGGHSHGDLASRLLIAGIERLAEQASGYTLVGRLADRIHEVNDTLRAHGRERCNGAVVGTTVAVLAMEADTFHYFWAGDSRIYILREDILTQLTVDHVEPRPPDTHSDSGNARLTRAVGALESLEVDYRHGILYEGDRFAIVSDGVSRVLDDRDIAHSLSADYPDRACDCLLSRVMERGAPDNASCVAVFVAPDSARGRP